MSVTLISHESDLDGIFSVAIALIKFPKANAFFLGYSTDSFFEIAKIINRHKRKDDITIISDLGFDDNFTELFEKTLNKSKNFSQIYWIDHHPWSDTAIKILDNYIHLGLDSSEKEKKCASEIMYETFLKENKIAETLSSLASSMDFFKKDQYVTPLSELIRYYNSFSNKNQMLYRLAKKASKGILWDVEMQSDYNYYSKLSSLAKEEAMKKMKIIKISKFNIAFVQSSQYIQNSLFSEEIFNLTKCDVIVFYDYDGKISIRRNTTEINCNDITANLQFGGGHKFAAGGMLEIIPKNINDVINEIEKAINKIEIK